MTCSDNRSGEQGQETGGEEKLTGEGEEVRKEKQGRLKEDNKKGNQKRNYRKGK